MLVSICALMTLVVLLVLIYAIAPLVIRSQLRRSTLSFQQLQIDGQPTDTRLSMRTTATIGNVLNFKAKVASMELTVYQIPTAANGSALSSPPADALELGRMTLPALQLAGPITLHMSNDFVITHYDHFAAFTHSMVGSPSVEWLVEGSTSVTPSLAGISLPTYSNIPFSKRVRVPGCDGLRDFELLSFDMRHSTSSQIIMASTVRMVNPSPFALHPVGRLHFDLFYRDVKQGSLYSFDNTTHMDAGVNFLNFTGFLDPDPSRPDVTNELVSRYLTGLGVSVEARASLNASSIPLYSQALQGLTLPISIPGIANGSLIAQLELVAAEMAPSLSEPAVHFDMTLEFTVASPLGTRAPMDVRDMQMSVQVAFLNHTVDETGAAAVVPVTIGTLAMDQPVPVTPVYPSDASQSDPQPTFTFRATFSADMQLLSPQSNYQEFVRAFVATTGKIGLEFTGTANVSATYLYGNLTVLGVPVINTLFIQGAQGLNQTDEKSLRVTGNRESCAATALQSSAPFGPPVSDPVFCGVWVELVASITNPSPLTLNLSNAWFDLRWGGSRLGSVQITPLFIRPGLNADMRASGFLDPAAQDLPTMALFMSQYVNGINHTVVLRGLAYDPSLSSAMQQSADPAQSAHQLTLASIEAPAICHGLRLPSMLGDFSVQSFIFSFGQTSLLDDGSYTLAATAVVGGRVMLPPSLTMPLHVTSSAVDFNVLFDADGSGALGSVGSMSVTRFPVVYASNSSDELVMAFPASPFRVSAGEVAAFQAFTAVMVSTTGLDATMRGSADPSADTNMGSLDLTGVPVDGVVSLTGFNSFYSIDGQSLVDIVHLDLLSASVASAESSYGGFMGGGTIELSCNVTLQNPSQVAIMDLGLLEFDVWYDGVRLVTVHLTNFSFALGLNRYEDSCRGTFWSPVLAAPDDPVGLEQMAVAQRFLSRYIDGYDSNVTMVGRILQPDGSYRSGTALPLLQPAFDAFTTGVAVPGQPQPFITQLVVDITWTSAAKIIQDGGGILPARAHLFNPFATALTVTNLNLSVLAGDLSAPLGGWLVQDVGIEAVFIPARSAVVTETLPVYLMWTPAVIVKLLTIFLSPDHSTGVSLIGDLTVWVGSTGPGQPDPRVVFNQTFHAVQENIKTTIGNITVTRPGPPSTSDEDARITRASQPLSAQEQRDKDTVLSWMETDAWMKDSLPSGMPASPSSSPVTAPAAAPVAAPDSKSPRRADSRAPADDVGPTSESSDSNDDVPLFSRRRHAGHAHDRKRRPH